MIFLSLLVPQVPFVSGFAFNYAVSYFDRYFGSGDLAESSLIFDTCVLHGSDGIMAKFAANLVFSHTTGLPLNDIELPYSTTVPGAFRLTSVTCPDGSTHYARSNDPSLHTTALSCQELITPSQSIVRKIAAACFPALPFRSSLELLDQLASSGPNSIRQTPLPLDLQRHIANQHMPCNKVSRHLFFLGGDGLPLTLGATASLDTFDLRTLSCPLNEASGSMNLDLRGRAQVVLPATDEEDPDQCLRLVDAKVDHTQICKHIEGMNKPVIAGTIYANGSLFCQVTGEQHSVTFEKRTDDEAWRADRVKCDASRQPKPEAQTVVERLIARLNNGDNLRNSVYAVFHDSPPGYFGDGDFRRTLIVPECMALRNDHFAAFSADDICD